MQSIIEASVLAAKWKRYREHVYCAFVAVADEKRYRDRMSLVQTIIKGCMEKDKLELMDAILKLAGEEEDPHVTMHILAAGYELALGSDFTHTNIPVINQEKEEENVG